MKILFVTESVFDPHKKEYSKSKGGINLYVRTLANELAKEDSLYIITHAFGTDDIIDGIHYMKHSVADMLLKFVSIKNIIQAIKVFAEHEAGIKDRIKASARYIDNLYINKAVINLNPDIVHIHGCTKGCIELLEECRKNSIPTLITLHGLLGDNEFCVRRDLIELEKKLLEYIDRNNLQMTVISTGIREKIASMYLFKNISNIHVVLNGTGINNKIYNESVIDRYNLSNLRLITDIGSIIPLKNQIQLLNAWNLISEEQKKGYKLLLIGKELDEGLTRNYIHDNNIENVMMTGFILPDEINSILEKTCLNITCSLSEGFGLTIIEAMSHGVPTIMYEDQLAFVDIYDESAIIGLKDRSTETLADAIIAAIGKKWDKEKIKESSQRFALDKTISDYKDIYEKCIANNNK